MQTSNTFQYSLKIQRASERRTHSVATQGAGSLFLQFLPALCFAAFLVLMALGTTRAVREERQARAYLAQMQQVQVIPPAGVPLANQESIDFAMELFSIDLPSFVAGPSFDANLEDRGLTTGGTLSVEKAVTVGPAAFTSWGILGSTLGHEVEIHARQVFLEIFLIDRFASLRWNARKMVGRVVKSWAPSVQEIFENEGTWRAEREAYQYEIDSAARFTLTHEELMSILYVMNYYYPVSAKKAQTYTQLTASAE